MFRYIPLWQVLYKSLDHDFKSSVVKNSPCDACTHHLGEEQSVIHSHHSLRPPLLKTAQNNPPSRVPMTSTPKRWVIKPLSPRLEQSDLRSILSPIGHSRWSRSQDSDSPSFSFENISVIGMQSTVMVSYKSDENTPVVVQAHQVALSEDGSDSEDWRPSNPNSPGTPSSTGSNVGFYSFVDDPASLEAEMNEVYMVSPVRQAKLNTLKEKSTFRLQTYVEEKRPGRLFEETNGDERYQVENASKVHEAEDSPDRIEIIRNQAPKKNPALKEQWSALENLDLSSTPQRLLDGFSLRYTSVSPKAEQTKAEPGTIDNEQIDFNAARKQFLMMEQSKQNPFLQSPQQLPYSSKLRGRTLTPMANIFLSKQVSQENSFRENRIPLRTQQKAKSKTVTLTEDPEDVVSSGAIDDVDSGLGDRSGDYASDESVSNDFFVLEMGSNLSVHNAEETPIEREIRIAQEREESLRRSRGILRTDNSEMVEIRTKPIVTHLSPHINPPKARDTNRVSFLIQRELELEKRRQSQNRFSNPNNQEHHGKVKQKGKASESQDEGSITSLMTNPTEFSTNELQERAASMKDTTEEPVHKAKGDLSGLEEGLSSCCPYQHPDEFMLHRNYNDSRTFGNQDVKVHISAYPKENIQSKVKVYKENIFETQTSSFKNRKEPFWIAENGTSVSGRKRFSSLNIPSPLEPTKTSQYAPVWTQVEHTSWSPQLQNAPDSIRQEIEQDLRRERELQELREFSSQSFSTNRSLDNSASRKLALTSTETRYPHSSSEETEFSSQTPQKDLTEVDSGLLEKKKTDDSYLYSWSLNTSSVSQLSVADKGSQLSSPQLNSRLPSVSIITPQPWGSTNPISPTISQITPIQPLSPHAEVSSPLSQKGLTETLLKDFEDRRIKLKLEESAYAGIQPFDDVNNEVVEVTRVTRHKNQRTLQWEAGMYTNQEA